MAFTTAELREMVRLPECKPRLHAENFNHLSESVAKLPRAKRRLVELMMKTCLNPDEKDVQRWQSAKREWELQFLRTPLEFLGDENGVNLRGIKFAVNELKDDGKGGQKAVATDTHVELQTALAFRSIGYRSVPIDTAQPFDSSKAIVPNMKGRVSENEGLYCSGWVKTGPIGVIATTMTNGFETGKAVVDDLKKGVIKVQPQHTGFQEIQKVLESKKIKVITFKDWETIDNYEVQKGEPIGKPREKIPDVETMLKVATS